MDITALRAALFAHQYVLFAALSIGFVVRILKSDTKIPVSIPPRYRIWLAFGLGAAAGVLEKVSSGTEWKPALFDGALSAVFAILGQNVVIDSFRGGKEISIPGLMVAGERPSPGKPPTIPPDAPPSSPSVIPPLTVLAALAVSAILAGCPKAITALELLADKAACVVANQELENEEIFLKCAIQPGDVPRYVELLSESRAATRKALEKAGASPRVDAGVRY